MLRTTAMCLAMLLAAGCKSKPAESPLPQSLKECREQAALCRVKARDARIKEDADSVAQAAQRARKIADHAQTLRSPATVEAESAMMADILLAANLAQDETVLTGKLTSWSAKAYRKGRNVAVSAALKAMAAVARQAKGQDLEKMDPRLRDAAVTAAEVAAFLTDKPRRDPPDWEATAQELEKAARDNPARLGEMLALGLAASGRFELALIESWQLDPDSARDPNEHSLGHIGRGMCCSFNDMPYLAVEEIEHLMTDAERAGNAGATQETLGLIHLVLAIQYLQSNKLTEAEGQLAKAMHVWPNNPLTVYLTGEVMAADGRKEQAAESLENLAKGSQNEAMAGRLAQRARDIRNGKRNSFLKDPALLLDLLAMSQGVKPGSFLDKLYKTAQTAISFAKSATGSS